MQQFRSFDPQTNSPISNAFLPRLSKVFLELPPAIYDEMNEIMNARAAQGLSVFNMNQGLVRAPDWWGPALEDSIGSAFLEDVWKMGPVPGLYELREAIATWRSHLFGTDISAENIFITQGCNAAFTLILLAISDIGERVQLTSPYFFNHPGAITVHGRTYNTVPLDPDHGFSLNPAFVEALWTSQTKAILIVNPGNPTGTAISRNVINEVEEIAKRKNGWVIIDESYGTLPSHEAFLETSGKPFDIESTLVIGSFSKSLCLGDMRLGYIVCTKEMIEPLTRIQDNLSICSSIFNQRVALAAIQKKLPLQNFIQEQLRIKAQVIRDSLQGVPEISAIIGGDAVFFWVKPTMEVEDHAFCRSLAHETGVITTPGSFYSAPGWLRLSYGMLSGPEEACEACEILKRFL